MSRDAKKDYLVSIRSCYSVWTSFVKPASIIGQDYALGSADLSHSNNGSTAA